MGRSTKKPTKVLASYRTVSSYTVDGTNPRRLFGYSSSPRRRRGIYQDRFPELSNPPEPGENKKQIYIHTLKNMVLNFILIFTAWMIVILLVQ